MAGSKQQRRGSQGPNKNKNARHLLWRPKHVRVLVTEDDPSTRGAREHKARERLGRMRQVTKSKCGRGSPELHTPGGNPPSLP